MGDYIENISDTLFVGKTGKHGYGHLGFLLEVCRQRREQFDAGVRIETVAPRQRVQRQRQLLR